MYISCFLEKADHDYQQKWAHKELADQYLQCASVSKFFCGLTVLYLAQGEVLNIDLPVNAYLESWKLRNSSGEIDTGVTIRELLSHRGGTSVTGFDGYRNGERIPRLIDILEGRGNSPKVEVISSSKQFSYSGGGTTILQYVVEQVTGKSYADVCLSVIHQLDEKSTATFRMPDGNILCGHDTQGSRIKGCFNVYPELAAAGLWMTPRSLANLLQELLEILAGKESKILQKETLSQMFQNLGKGREGGSVGLGCFLSTDNKYFFHTGFNYGYRSLVAGSVTGNAGLIAMMNDETSMQDIVAKYRDTEFGEFLQHIK